MNSISARWTPAERELQFQHILSWIGNDAIAAAIRDSLGTYQDIDHTIDLLSSNEDLINALKNQKGSVNIKNEEEFEIIKNRMTAIPAFIYHIDCQHPSANALFMGKHHASCLRHSMEDFDVFVNNIHLKEYSSIHEELRIPDWCAVDRSKDALWDTLFEDVCQHLCMKISHSGGSFPSSIESDRESNKNEQISTDMVDGEKNNITLVLDIDIHDDEDTSTAGGGDSVISSVGRNMVTSDSGEYADDELGSVSLHRSITTDDGYSTGTDTHSNSHVVDAIDSSARMMGISIVHSVTVETLSEKDGDRSDGSVSNSNEDDGASAIKSDEAEPATSVPPPRKIGTGAHTTTAVGDIMHRTDDADLVFLYKMRRKLEKKTRRTLSKHLTGTSRNYEGALHTADPYAITIQKYVRRFLSTLKINKMRGNTKLCNKHLTFNRHPVRTPGNDEKDWGAATIMLILQRQYECTIRTDPHHLVYDWQLIDLLVRDFGDKIGSVVSLGHAYTSICYDKFASNSDSNHASGFVRIHMYPATASDWDLGIRMCSSCYGQFGSNIHRGIGTIFRRHRPYSDIYWSLPTTLAFGFGYCRILKRDWHALCFDLIGRSFSFLPHLTLCFNLNPLYHCCQPRVLTPLVLFHLVLRMGRFWILGR
jgi:hypothetical protein